MPTDDTTLARLDGHVSCPRCERVKNHDLPDSGCHYGCCENCCDHEAYTTLARLLYEHRVLTGPTSMDDMHRCACGAWNELSKLTHATHVTDAIRRKVLVVDALSDADMWEVMDAMDEDADARGLARLGRAALRRIAGGDDG